MISCRGSGPHEGLPRSARIFVDEFEEVLRGRGTAADIHHYMQFSQSMTFDHFTDLPTGYRRLLRRMGEKLNELGTGHLPSVISPVETRSFIPLTSVVETDFTRKLELNPIASSFSPALDELLTKKAIGNFTRQRWCWRRKVWRPG